MEYLLVRDSNGDIFIVRAIDWNDFGILARGTREEMELELENYV